MVVVTSGPPGRRELTRLACATMIRRTVPLVPSIVALAVAVACSSTPATIDGAKLAANIQQDAATTDLKVTGVDCPQGRVAQANDQFQCTAKLVGGATLLYDVSITSASGDYTYKLAPNQMFDGAAVAKELTDDISTSTAALADAKATCPKTIVAAGGKATFECSVTTGGQTVKLTVTKEAGKKAEWDWKTDPAQP